jgi:hypothetical protein
VTGFAFYEPVFRLKVEFFLIYFLCGGFALSWLFFLNQLTRNILTIFFSLLWATVTAMLIEGMSGGNTAACFILGLLVFLASFFYHLQAYKVQKDDVEDVDIYIR